MQEMEEAEALAQRNANLVHAITYQVRPFCQLLGMLPLAFPPACTMLVVAGWAVANV